MLLAAVLSAALVLVLFLFNTQSPSSAAAEFMSALAKQDIDQLTELSTLHDESPDQIREAWKKTFDLSKHYLFVWEITSTDVSGDSASVKLTVLRNAARQMAYQENYALVLVRTDGKWKVDVTQIPRAMFPNLPR